MLPLGRRLLSLPLTIHSHKSLPSTFPAFRSFTSYSSKLSTFDERWKKLTQAEKDLVAKEYEHLQKGDWKSLTIDQKRILYTIAYGVPENNDPKEGLKIGLTTMALVGVAVGLFAFIRSFANPPPKTTGNKEWQEATKEILRSQNSNPISGISSKPADDIKEEEF